MELPEELLIEILLQLPVKSLLRCKCVCKDWRSLIQSAQFVERQYQISHTRSNKILCYRKDPITETYVISVLDRHTLEELEDLEWPPFLEEEGVEDAENSLRGIKIFGPVNGIYCIHRSLIDKWVGTLTLWNPATREYKHIHPQVSFPFPLHLLGFKYFHYDQREPLSLHIGFGFDQTTNDYKVVVICGWLDADTGIDCRWHLRVYNHASDSWKPVYFLSCVDDPHPLFEGLRIPFPLIEQDPPISHCLLNGVFHWACSLKYAEHTCYSVLAFDMSTDAMRLMKGPTTLLGQHWSVWALKGTIAAVFSNYSVCHSSEDVEVWMMMEYGVENSWAILFTIRGVNDWIPVGVPFDDRVFFENQNGQLFSSGFDDDNRVEEFGVYGMKYSTHNSMQGILGIVNYVESLVTIKPA